MADEFSGNRLMPRSVFLLFLAVLATSQSADEIIPVRDWDHFRDRLLADGNAPGEADERMASMLGALRDMGRDAGADPIGRPLW